MKAIYIVTFYCFQLYSSHSQSFYFEDGDTLTIISKSGSNLRDSNSITSTKIASIPFGDKVIARNTKCCIYYEREKFDNRYGAWINVEYKGKIGFIFSGNLTRLKIPFIDFESIDCYDSGLFEKIIRYNADSLICSGSRIYKGFDQDGKDGRSSSWELFNTETEINQIGGYEWRELIIESAIMDMNDILNLCEYFLDKLKNKCDNYWSWRLQDEHRDRITFVKDDDYVIKIYCRGLGISAEKSDYKTIISIRRDE